MRVIKRKQSRITHTHTLTKMCALLHFTFAQHQRIHFPFINNILLNMNKNVRASTSSSMDNGRVTLWHTEQTEMCLSNWHWIIRMTCTQPREMKNGKESIEKLIISMHDLQIYIFHIYLFMMFFFVSKCVVFLAEVAGPNVVGFSNV